MDSYIFLTLILISLKSWKFGLVGENFVFGKLYSIEYFSNTKVPGLDEIFVQRKFRLYGTCV